MNKPPYKKEDEEIKDIELPEATAEDIQDELEQLPAWKEFVNDGMESITYGDY
jgi:hypothetical protein